MILRKLACLAGHCPLSHLCPLWGKDQSPVSTSKSKVKEDEYGGAHFFQSCEQLLYFLITVFIFLTTLHDDCRV